MPQTRNIISELASKSREDVEAEIDQIRDEIQRLELEEQLLTAVLRLLDSSNGASVAAPPESPAPRKAKRERGAVSEGVLAVVQSNPGRSMSPAAVQRELAETFGTEADLNGIRVALRRWADRGAIKKDGTVYRALPPQAPNESTILFPREHRE
jgi:hypothetical protein